MSDSTIEALRQRVQALMPALKIEDFEVNQEGLINEVVIVNQSLVFRFARTESYADILDVEMQILDRIRPRLALTIPTPLYYERGSVVYPFVEGQPLLRSIVVSVDHAVHAQIAAELGAFLYSLHTTPVSDLAAIPATLAPVTHTAWVGLYQRIQDTIYPLLLPHQRRWADTLFDPMLTDPQAFAYHPALIHGDLAPYHILFDRDTNHLTGILDFGVAGMGDPALDIGNLLTAYGESFVRTMQVTYPTLDTYLPRARFYAQAIEFQWVLQGIETGETFWFTAHLGGARDIYS